jgi:hypothetical protein
VVAISRNKWSQSIGTFGRNQSERVVAISRNEWSQSVGARNQNVSDKSIQRAIEIGKKNKQIVELICNWCAHIAINRHGVGIVEIDTGLAIGHRPPEMRRPRQPLPTKEELLGDDARSPEFATEAMSEPY